MSEEENNVPAEARDFKTFDPKRREDPAWLVQMRETTAAIEQEADKLAASMTIEEIDEALLKELTESELLINQMAERDHKYSELDEKFNASVLRINKFRKILAERPKAEQK